MNDSAATNGKPERVRRYLLHLWTDGENQTWAILPEFWEPGDSTPDVFATGYGSDNLKRWQGGITKSPKPGQIYAFDMDKNGATVYFSTTGKRQNPTHAECVGYSDNHELNARCLAKQAAYDAEQANEKRARGGTRGELLSFLDPIRLAYHKLPMPARAQLLGMVIDHITRGTLSDLFSLERNVTKRLEDDRRRANQVKVKKEKAPARAQENSGASGGPAPSDEPDKLSGENR